MASRFWLASYVERQLTSHFSMVHFSRLLYFSPPNSRFYLRKMRHTAQSDHYPGYQSRVCEMLRMHEGIAAQTATKFHRLKKPATIRKHYLNIQDLSSLQIIRYFNGVTFLSSESQALSVLAGKILQGYNTHSYQIAPVNSFKALGDHSFDTLKKTRHKW